MSAFHLLQDFGKCGHSFCVLILSLKIFLRVFAFLRLVTDYRSKGKGFGRKNLARSRHGYSSFISRYVLIRYASWKFISKSCTIRIRLSGAAQLSVFRCAFIWYGLCIYMHNINKTAITQ